MPPANPRVDIRMPLNTSRSKTLTDLISTFLRTANPRFCVLPRPVSYPAEPPYRAAGRSGMRGCVETPEDHRRLQHCPLRPIRPNERGKKARVLAVSTQIGGAESDPAVPPKSNQLRERRRAILQRARLVWICCRAVRAGQAQGPNKIAADPGVRRQRLGEPDGICSQQVDALKTVVSD